MKKKRRNVSTKKTVVEKIEDMGMHQITIDDLLYPESNKKSYQSNPRKIIQNDE